jgi:predicted neuraminidase
VYKGLPPNILCCDATLRRLPGGDLAAFFTTGGDVEPSKANHVVMSTSTDDGCTWGAPTPVLKSHYKASMLSEVIVHDGRITVIAQTHGGMFDHWRVCTLTSQDDGRHWSIPAPFTAMPERAFIRTLYTASWQIWYLPFQYYPPDGDWATSPLEERRGPRALNGCLISTDRGETWERSATIGPVPGWTDGLVWAENNITELSDGRLVMLIRADGTGELLRSESVDRGLTWSEPTSSGIPNPGAKFRLFRVSDGRIALLHNPNPVTRHPNSKVQAAVNRNPLALWVSADDMATWYSRRILTDFPGMLAYPDGFLDEESGMLHFAFDYNRHDVIYFGARLPSPPPDEP